MNQQTFRNTLTLLSDAMNKKLTPDLIRYWWNRYGDLPDDVLSAAFQQALDTCDYFPTPAKFNEILRGLSAASGAIVDGASAWEAMDRALFSCWSETNDRVNIRATGYPWPDERCRAILRGEMRCTVRDVAEMHPAEYAKTRERFIALYDAQRNASQAEATVAKLAAPAPTPLPAQAARPPRLRPVVGGDHE